jgi:hypothetical protein
MKTFNKKILSIIMAAAMVVTMIPMGAFVAEAAVKWTAVASSDFSKASVSAATASGLTDKYDATVTAPAYIPGSNTIDWVSRVYQPTTYSYAVLDDYNSDGTNDALYINNGYMYMNMKDGSNNPTTPLKNATRFRIDFGFRYKENYTVSDDGTYTFLKLGAYGDSNNFIPGWGDHQTGYSTLAQSAGGRVFSYDTKITDGSTDKRIATNGTYISSGTSYHYIAEYTGTRLRVYVTDANYKTVLTLVNTTDSSTYKFSDIETGLANAIYFKIGACDEAMYLRYLEYENITFYTGSTYTDSSKNEPSNNSDKFLMAYFIGNYNLERESLRYAVSSDGVNFHTLNKGKPVTTINIPASGEGLTVYPTGGDTGAFSTGHIRDPYILKKHDGSGYYILATDLDTEANPGFNLNAKFLVWDVANLKDVRNTQPWAIDIRGLFNAYPRRAWAPQAIWDENSGKYMLYFSAKCDGVANDTTNLYYVFTSDFKSFTGTPRRLINSSVQNIDADITYNSSDDLYYMYYKNESAEPKEIYYATSSSINGPYSDAVKFAEGKEGPQVYKKLDGNYVLLLDNYGEYAEPGNSAQGVFKVYQSSTINGFNANNETSSTIPYLYARHASVVRITNAEYNALISEYGDITKTDGTQVEYYFTGCTSRDQGSNNEYNNWYGDGSDHTGVKDPSEHHFFPYLAYSGATSYSASNGFLTLNNANVFMMDDDLRTILKSNAFTVNFKVKITDAANLSNDIPIAVIANSSKDFINVTTSGKFIVDGKTVSNLFTLSANTEYDFSISYNGNVVKLFKDGVFVKSIALGDSIADSSGSNCYLSFGWSDNCGNNRSTKISAQYSNVVINNTALSIDSESEELDGNKELADYADRVLVAYESKMADLIGNNIYRNMGTAYKAYVDLNEARDAAKYGNSSSAQVKAAAKALETATDNMTTWSASTAAATTKMRDDSDTIPSAYAQNLLYADPICDTSNAPITYYSNGSLELFTSKNTVALYKGGYNSTNTENNITIPLMVGFAGKGTGNNDKRKVVYCIPMKDANSWSSAANEYFQLPGFWRSNGGSACKWQTEYNGSTQKIAYYAGQSDKDVDTALTDSNNWKRYSNYMYYNQTGTNQFTNRLHTVTVNWYAKLCYGSNNNVSDLYGYQNVYIINYVGVPEKVNTYKDIVDDIDITEYKEGGLLTFLNTLDTITYDVATADYASNPSGTASTVATNLNNAMNSIDTLAANINTAKDDTTKYQVLRNAMDYEGKPSAIDSSSLIGDLSLREVWENNGHINVDGHDIVLENYSTFEAKYEQAQDLMAYLGTASYNTNNISNYGTNRSETADYAQQLLAAFNALDKTYSITFTKADSTSTVKTAEVGRGVDSIPANTNKTYSSADTHTVYSWHDNPTTDNVYWADTTYLEDTASEACTYVTGSITSSQKICTCSECTHNKALSLTEYSSALSTAEPKISTLGNAETQASTTTTLTALSNEVSNANTALASDAVDTQGEVDVLTSGILTKLGELKAVANFSGLDSAYSTADTLLKSIKGKEAQYKASSIQSILDAIDNANADITSSTATRLNTAEVDRQTEITNEATAITTAISNLSNAENANFIDVSAFTPAYNKITKLDKDAYDETSDSIRIAIDNAVSDVTYSTKSYDDGTINVIDDSVSQQDVNDATSTILSALNSSVKQYKIYASDGVTVGGNDGTYNVASAVEIAAETALGVGHEGYKGKGTYGVKLSFNSGDDNTAWYMSYDSALTGRNEQYLGYGRSVQTGVSGNLHVRAVKRTNDAPYKVTIARTYSDNPSTHGIQRIDYTGSSFTLPTAPALAYYTFAGYSYGDHDGVTYPYYSSGDTVTINGNASIQAIYNKAIDNSYTVKISSASGDGDLYDDSAPFNTKIETSAAGAYGWVKVAGGKETMFYVGSDLTYFVTDSIELKAVASKPGSYTGVPTVYLRDNGGAVITHLTDGSGKSKITLNGNYVSDGYEVLEYGVLLGMATTGTITDDDVVVENSGSQTGYNVLRAKATKTVGANQFSIGVTTSKTGAFKYRGYVMYKVGAEIKTVYTNVFNGTI